MNEIEEKAKKYLEEKPTPRLSVEEIESLLDEVHTATQPKQPKRIVFWQRFAIACCCLLVVLPCVLLPILLRPQDETFYGEDEVLKTELTIDYAQEYIQQNYAQYSFIFEDCTINSVSGFNEVNSNKLVAISIVLVKNEKPRTVVEFNLIMDRKYKFAQDEKYTKDAEITKYSDYTLYKKYINISYDSEILALKDCQDYKLYLEFSLPDEEFLEKFL